MFARECETMTPALGEAWQGAQTLTFPYWLSLPSLTAKHKAYLWRTYFSCDLLRFGNSTHHPIPAKASP